MPIYHLNVKVLRRCSSNGQGQQSALQKAQYDARDGKFSNRGDLVTTNILAPDGAPKWVFDRITLWTTVDTIERKRKDSQLARTLTLALPKELDKDTQIAIVEKFFLENFVKEGMIVQYSIHFDPDKENPHCHGLVTLRRLVADDSNSIESTPELSPALKFGKKEREWNRKFLLKQWREAWAECCNRYLGQKGYSLIDHRSKYARGLPDLPTINEGVKATMAGKKGYLLLPRFLNTIIRCFNQWIKLDEHKRNEKILSTVNTMSRNYHLQSVIDRVKSEKPAEAIYNQLQSHLQGKYSSDLDSPLRNFLSIFIEQIRLRYNGHQLKEQPNKSIFFMNGASASPLSANTPKVTGKRSHDPDVGDVPPASKKAKRADMDSVNILSNTPSVNDEKNNHFEQAADNNHRAPKRKHFSENDSGSFAETEETIKYPKTVETSYAN